VLQGHDPTPAAPVLPRRGSDDDLAILRGFIWCAICDQAMTPVGLPTGVRHYRCGDPECPRRLVLAEVAERLVWDHFAYLNPAQAQDVPPEGRRDALHQVLRKVWVGYEVYNLYYEWHD
jgi:hypothetical protein